MRLYHGVMMEKFNGKYRIPSARWAAWNYGSNGAYFVTICTANHAHYFGKITNNEMVPTPLGRAEVDFWNEIPAHFPFVELDAFVVMPNHVHGIIIIDKPGGIVETQDFASRLTQTQDRLSRCSSRDASLPRTHPENGTEASDLRPGVIETPVDRVKKTQDFASLPGGNRFGPQSRNLASIVRGYKIGITKYARQNNAPFIWQERYYDHIIRSPDEHELVWQYILANPLTWAEDKFYC